MNKSRRILDAITAYEPETSANELSQGATIEAAPPRRRRKSNLIGGGFGPSLIG